MPAVNTGRENTTVQPPRTTLKKTKRVTVAPADRAAERVAARKTQIANSRSASPDRQDTKRSPAQQARDRRVVATNVATARKVAFKNQKSVDDAGPVKLRPEYAASRARSQKQTAARVAPVLTVLEQTTRPVHGVAAGTRAAIKGQNPLPAVGRGLTLKDKSLFSDVLKDLGVTGPAAGLAGFALDVVLDPTTYISGGTASIASKAASKAATRVEKKALAAGLTPEQAKRFAVAAGKQAHKRAGTARGTEVKVAGKAVPGVTRATAAVGKGAKKAAGKPGRGVAAVAKKVAGDFSTGVVPAGIDRTTYGAVRSATRTARSSSSREVYKVRQRAGAVQRAIGKDDYHTVLDAIESGTTNALPSHLRAPAKFLRDQFKYARRVEKRAGIKGATRKNYVPHLRTDLAEEGKGIGGSSVGARTIAPSSSKARKDDRSLADIRKTDPGKYVEDPGVLYASRLSESAGARAKAELNRRLGDLGSRVKQHAPLALKPGEAVFHIKGSDIRQLDPGKAADRTELQAFVDGSGRKGGAYVALNERAVNQALKTVQPGADRSTTGLIFDRAQGVWKLAATQVNPGFHVRNLVGDAQNAYLGQNAGKLAVNLGHSARALGELGRQERALKTLDHVGRRIDPAGKGVKIGGQKVPYGQLIAEAEKVGGVRSGFVSRELHDLLEGRAAQPKTRGEALRRWANNREDVIRLATYIGARQRGLGAEEAASYVAKHHFDYSDLTELERRVMRRVMPFWTFSARNIPLQFKSLVSRPGKYAQYEKVREEIAKAFGYPDDWENDLSESEQRGAPIAIRIGGKPYTISLGPSGLPLTDLNEFPTSANPAKQADEWINRAMSLITPAIKTPVELWSNMSFFFREPIERDDAPLVPISSLIVKTVPPGLRKQLGITPDYVDKRSGKKQWAAPARLVYALGVLPGPASFVNRVTTPSERAGQDTKSKTVGYLGLRVKPIDAVSTQINNLYDEREKVDKKMRALNQQGINAGHSTPEYRQLALREKDITSHVMALRTKRGDKILPGGAMPSSGGDDEETQKLLKGIGAGGSGTVVDQEEIDKLLRGIGAG